LRCARALLIPPNESSRLFINGIIAIPGDRRLTRNGVIWINGRVIDEPDLLEPFQPPVPAAFSVGLAHGVRPENAIGSTWPDALAEPLIVHVPPQGSFIQNAKKSRQPL
jgi:hypothetical protein